MKIIIVGAGIGGLTTALQLHRRGIHCEVYEQSEQMRELGVGINLLPHAIKELAELGLLDELDEVGIRTRELYYTHRLGHEIMHRPCGLDAARFPKSVFIAAGFSECCSGWRRSGSGPAGYALDIG